MNLPRFRHTPVSIWLTEAMTEFINGFIDGWGGGLGTGAGTGVITGTTDVGADLSALNQVMLSVGAVLAAMVGSGCHAVFIWHKTNRFPNPFYATPPTSP